MKMTSQVATPQETPGQPTLFTQPVLLADDGSDEAEVARRAAADLAAPSGVPLHIVTAWTLPATMAAPVAPALPEGAWEIYTQGARETQDLVRRQLASLGATAVTGHVVEGTA